MLNGFLRWRRQSLWPATLVVSVLSAVVIWAIYHANGGWAYDTLVYRMGGSIVLHGGALYAPTTPHPYTYSPFSAVLFVPLAWMPIGLMSVVWTTLSVAGFIVSTWITLGWLGIRDDAQRVTLAALVCILFLWLDPIADTLLGGQVNLIVMGIVLADLALPDSNRWKGIGLGFAASFKLLPLFFVMYLLVTRRFAPAARAITAFLATVVIGFLLVPQDSIGFWRGTFLNSSRVGDAQNPRSESLLSLLVRWTHQSSTSVRPVWLLLAALTAVAILALALWAHRRGDELLAVCIAAAGTLYLSPITWRHHWVWILPMLLWLIRWALVQVWLWLPVAVIALDFYLRPYAGIVVNPVADLHLSLGQLLLSSTHPVSIALFLICAIGIMRSSPAAVDSSATRSRLRRSKPALPRSVS